MHENKQELLGKDSLLLEAMQTNNPYTTTENGAVTHDSSLNPLLDLFFIAGASRNMSEEDIMSLLSKAFNNNPLLTYKIIFWARDIRGGAGERRFFRIARDYVYLHRPEAELTFLFNLTPTYGRRDDIWTSSVIPQDIIVNHLVKKIIYLQDFNDTSTLGLLCKWLPRKGSLATAIRKYFKRTAKEYRHFVVLYTKVVEQQMSARQWDEIVYDNVPSVAFNNYKEAFRKHSEERFDAFVAALKEGKAKVNAATLFPHDIGKQIKLYYYTPANLKKMDVDLLQAQWDALPQYELSGSVLPVVDVSGSMSTTLGGESTTTALHTSVSLGVYLAEKIQGPFKDHIISFSGRPSLHHLTGNIVEKYLQANDSGEDMSTNLVGVFEALLHAANKNNISQEDMPKTLIILSDMEFNQCGNNSETNYRYIKNLYKASNYEMPKLVFWNLLGRLNNYPVQATTPNTILLSGYSPSLMRTVLKGSLNPVDAMLDTINVDRYNFREIPSSIN